MGRNNQALQQMLMQMQQSGGNSPIQAAQQMNQIGQGMTPRGIPISPMQQGFGDDPYMSAINQMYQYSPQSYQPFQAPDMSFLTNPKTSGPLAGSVPGAGYLSPSRPSTPAPAPGPTPRGTLNPNTGLYENEPEGEGGE